MHFDIVTASKHASLILQGLAAHFRMPLQENRLLWNTVGSLGTLVFCTRFVIQWLYSEKHKESRVPAMFWWQSVLGCLLMLSYTLWKRDIILIIGNIFPLIPYTRNLMLIRRKRNKPNLLEDTPARAETTEFDSNLVSDVVVSPAA